MERYDDILHLSVKESYHTLPRKEKKYFDGFQHSFLIYSLLLRKTLGGFNFVVNKLPNVDLLLKLDDDLDIRSPLLNQHCSVFLAPMR